MRTLARLTLGLAVLVAAVAVGGSAVAAPVAARPNVVQTAVAAGQFKTLVSLVKKAGLAGVLSTRTVTVFAPTDAAFAKVPKSRLAKLGRNPALLKKVLLYHVAAGRLPASKVVEVHSIKTLEGSSLSVTVEGSTVNVGGATVVKPDVMARNGIIHVIDRVLIPSS
jgi:uncharacterized surface protein with fasciclin (FAS1) repeats